MDMNYPIRFLNGQDYYATRKCELSPEEIQQLSFIVYTKEELDQARRADQKRIGDLELQAQILNSNVKRLADLNDALTKRLNDLEKTADKK